VRQPPERSARRLTLTRAQVDRFAAASGDVNPLHVDPAFGRRSAFGGCIAHGALVTLAMLGTLEDAQLAWISSLRASFASAVAPDAELSVLARSGSRGRTELVLSGRGKQLARVLAGSEGDPAPPASAAALAGPPGELAPMRTRAAERTAGELHAGLAVSGAYGTGEELVELADTLGAGALPAPLREGLAWASYVVGMELPGRDALFTGVTLGAGGGGPAARQVVALREHDPRTGQLVLDGTLLDADGRARASARFECFLLAKPHAGPPAAILAPPAGAVRGEVVVVGGSRGFGAALVLELLAAGYGAHVVYAASTQSARALAEAAGPCRERLTLHELDARDPVALDALAERLRSRGAPLAGLILNAATPPLPMGVSASAAAELSAYVADNVTLTAAPLGALGALVDADAGWVVFTSSPAFATPPRDWPQYAAAKGAIEGLAHWLATTSPRLRTVLLRPPKMATDFTNTPSGRLGAAPADEIARWTVAQLAGGELGPGLAILEPGAAVSEREPVGAAT